ncbi:hypothetical protein, partial [Streptomyces sp. AB3(2024)]|uniref:hypothetical protein n=1 Tax=Streptomyces sp. AB3(2024) TaxID=3317321 RepID=UPI0035A3AD55
SFSKEPHPPKWTGYQLLALIFGTLLSSQGTDASFVLTSVTLTGAFLRAFVLFLRFRLYQTLSCPIFLGAFQVLRFRAFPFRRFRLYQKFSTGFPGFGFLIGESIAPQWNCIPWGRERF